MPNSYFIPERKTLEGKKLFFVSDAHLGLPNYNESLKREKLLIKWLDEIKNDASEIFLLGDIFDFWYEWKRVVPRGFVRLLAKIAELTDSGIPVHLFTGNHDIWVFDYLPHETGVILHTTPFSLEVAGKKIHIAHGDALGPGDYVFKFLKKLFTNKLLQWFFSRFHPNFARFHNFWETTKSGSCITQKKCCENMISIFLCTDIAMWLLKRILLKKVRLF